MTLCKMYMWLHIHTLHNCCLIHLPCVRAWPDYGFGAIGTTVPRPVSKSAMTSACNLRTR